MTNYYSHPLSPAQSNKRDININFPQTKYNWSLVKAFEGAVLTARLHSHERSCKGKNKTRLNQSWDTYYCFRIFLSNWKSISNWTHYINYYFKSETQQYVETFNLAYWCEVNSGTRKTCVSLKIFKKSEEIVPLQSWTLHSVFKLYRV